MRSLAIAAAAMALTGPVAAQSTDRIELADVAKDIKKKLRQFQADRVAVAEFAGPKEMPTGAGPGYALALREELTHLGVTVAAAAPHTVRGRYRPGKDRKTKEPYIDLAVWLEDSTGTHVYDLETRGIYGEEAFVAAAGLTVALTPKATEADRGRELVKAIEDDTKPFLDGTRVAASPDSPYAMDLRVKHGSEFVPLALKDDKGLAFAPIARDTVYAIGLHNRSAHDAAVTLTIDGLNLFAFSKVRDPKTGRPANGCVIVPAGKWCLVQGWPIEGTKSNAFLVTRYADSAAAELKSTAPVGVITACFAAAWPKGKSPPPDEPAAVSSRSVVGGDATGRGAEIETPFTVMERQFGVMRASVSIRYTR